jgi:pyruvate formate lyase activating enzyme
MAVCPRNLIREAGERYSPQQLVAKLEKNTKLLAASGGGVTFSGGEPLMQGAFLLECLSLLEGKLHRAIQTSGYADSALFAEVLAQCDYVLYDLKLMDPARHRYYCKADNTQILENYRILARSGKEFITRIPLIPTVNDTEENIKQTAAFMIENGVHRVELLPYHNMTGSKYAMTGRVYKPEFDETVKPKLHLDIFQSYRIEVTVL